MAKSGATLDVDSLREQLESVFRSWIVKERLPLEALSSITAETAQFLRRLERTLGVPAVEPSQKHEKPTPSPEMRRRGRKSDRPGKIIGILEKSTRPMQVAQVLELVCEQYPDEEWKGHQISTILGRAAKRPNSNVAARKKGKNFVYRFIHTADHVQQSLLEEGATQ